MYEQFFSSYPLLSVLMSNSSKDSLEQLLNHCSNPNKQTIIREMLKVAPHYISNNVFNFLLLQVKPFQIRDQSFETNVNSYHVRIRKPNQKLLFYKSLLENYIEQRNKEGEYNSTFASIFKSSSNQENKIAAATWLKQMLEKHMREKQMLENQSEKQLLENQSKSQIEEQPSAPNEISFDADIESCLHDGKLGEIAKLILEHTDIQLPSINKKLKY